MNENTKNILGYLIIGVSPAIIIFIIYLMTLFQNIPSLVVGITLIVGWIFWGVKWTIYNEHFDGKG